MGTLINLGAVVGSKQPLNIDLDLLLRTRLLVQGNSGSGKSRTLRRLAEQLFGHVQVIIIDLEGEFATLREKHEYVLVGKGGELAADVATAAAAARMILELRVSAVCDLYEMKVHERHRWVRLFLDALVDAPKELWHPVVIMIDEAHLLVPEKGQGESEAAGAMLDLCSRGRKRGYAPILFTQRLGKLSKNAAAELLNVLIGQTFIDIDVARASEALGIVRADQIDFSNKIRTMKPGDFWAFGRAICMDRTLVHVGDVATSHPEMGTFKHVHTPPPTPEKIRHLLPKFEELPKEAANKARTEAELRAEIIRLKSIVAAKPPPVPIVLPPPIPKVEQRVEKITVKVVDDVEFEKLEKALERAEGIQEKLWDIVAPVDGTVEVLVEMLEAAKKLRDGVPAEDKPGTFEDLVSTPESEAVKKAVAAAPPQPAPAPVPIDLTRSQKNILRALREFNMIDVDFVSRARLAGWLGLKVSGSFLNNLSALRTRALINYRDKDVLLTAEGLRHSPDVTVEPSSDSIFDHALMSLNGPQQEMMRILRSQYPNWFSRNDLAEKMGTQVSQGFITNLSGLKNAEMVEYGNGEMKTFMKLSSWMFVGTLGTVTSG